MENITNFNHTIYLMPVVTDTKSSPKREVSKLSKLLSIKPSFEDEKKNISLFKNDCFDILPQLPEDSIDRIFADPPYFLSNGGITCHAGKMVSVNKGKWDISNH